MTRINNVIGIIGRICSGKSFLAKKIKGDYNLQIVSFGTYLFNFSERNGLSTDRKALQDLGEDRISDNPRQFLTDVLQEFAPLNDTIIIEGIRHKVILDLLKEQSEDNVFIFLDEDSKTRYDRYISRVKETDSSLISYDKFIEYVDGHPVEQGIEELRKLCKLQISSTISNENLIESIPFLK